MWNQPTTYEVELLFRHALFPNSLQALMVHVHAVAVSSNPPDNENRHVHPNNFVLAIPWLQTPARYPDVHSTVRHDRMTELHRLVIDRVAFFVLHWRRLAATPMRLSTPPTHMNTTLNFEVKVSITIVPADSCFCIQLSLFPSGYDKTSRNPSLHLDS